MSSHRSGYSGKYGQDIPWGRVLSAVMIDWVLWVRIYK